MPESLPNQDSLKQKFLNHNKCNSVQSIKNKHEMGSRSPNEPKLAKQTSGLINLANGLPKRSESQKTRGASQPHFLKRKDNLSTVETQKDDVDRVLKSKENQQPPPTNSEKSESSDNLKKSDGLQQRSRDSSDQNCKIIESGVDKVTFNIKLKDDILSERDRMIKAIKVYIKKNKRLPPTTLDYYKFIKLVGKGAFGKVTLGVHKLTGKQVAIKTIEKAYMKDDFSRKKVLQEVYILKNIKHSNVIRLLEVFESPKHLLIVMEYSGGGDLLKYIKKNGKFEEQKAREIFIQITYGLAH